MISSNYISLDLDHQTMVYFNNYYLEIDADNFTENKMNGYLRIGLHESYGRVSFNITRFNYSNFKNAKNLFITLSKFKYIFPVLFYVFFLKNGYKKDYKEFKKIILNKIDKSPNIINQIKVSWFFVKEFGFYIAPKLNSNLTSSFISLYNKYISRGDTKRESFNKLFQKVDNKYYSVLKKEIYYGKYRIKLANDYSELIMATDTLRVCSAGRKDLVDGFLSGKDLRWSLFKDDKFIGTIALIPVNYCKSEFTGSYTHKLYGLTFSHRDFHTDNDLLNCLYFLRKSLNSLTFKGIPVNIRIFEEDKNFSFEDYFDKLNNQIRQREVNLLIV